MGIYLSPLQRILRFVVAGKIYLESGFINLLNYAPCNEDTYKPSLLQYNTEVLSYTSGSTTTYQGKLTVADVAPYFAGEGLQERDSLSTGCTDRIDSINPCGTTYTSVGAYCDGTEIQRKKFVQARVTPSVFSGLLQQFVQSLYGSTRSDYSTTEGYLLANFPLFVGGHQLGYEISPYTSGIFRTTDYRYWLLDIGLSSANAYLMTPSAEGENVRQHLLDYGGSMIAEELRKIEAYLLATLTISQAAQSITISGFPLTGEPVYYGWQFNKYGTEASIVLHRDNLPTDQNYHANQYRLNISESNGLLAIALTQVASNIEWSAVHGTNVLRPNNVTGGMVAMVNPKNTPFTGWPTLQAYDAPVYCFYNDADVLQVYKVVSAISSGNDVESYSDGYGIQSGTVVTYRRYVESSGRQLSVTRNGATLVKSRNDGANVSFDLTDWIEYDGTTSPPNFIYGTSNPSSNYSGEIEQLSGLTLYQFALNNGWFLPGTPYETGGHGPNGEKKYLGYAARENVCKNRYTNVQVGSSTISAKLTVAIPWASSKSVIAAVRNRQATNYDYYFELIRRTTSFPGLTQGERIYFDYYIPSGGGSPVYSNTRGPYKFNNRLFNQAGSDVIEGQTYYSYLPTVTVSVSTAKNAIVRVVDESLSYGNTIRDKYFDIQYVANPNVNFAALAKNSMMQADYAAFDGAYGQFSSGWLNNLSVGWA